MVSKKKCADTICHIRDKTAILHCCLDTWWQNRKKICQRFFSLDGSSLVSRLQRIKICQLALTDFYTGLTRKENSIFWHSLFWALGTNGLERSVLAPWNICFLKTINFIEVQKYLCGNNVFICVRNRVRSDLERLKNRLQMSIVHLGGWAERKVGEPGEDTDQRTPWDRSPPSPTRDARCQNRGQRENGRVVNLGFLFVRKDRLGRQSDATFMLAKLNLAEEEGSGAKL